MKKILMLGGAYSQIPAIRKAKEMGYYVITCDYLPGNPGHALSDEYVNVSTTDREGVLKVAREKEVDGVIAYASDPSAQAAAYAADQLGLAGGSFEATRMLSEKDLFRKFLREAGLNCPWCFSFSSAEEALEKIGEVSYPCVMKPVDSSGSKGVEVLSSEEEYRNALADAFRYTRCGRVIVEEFISTPYCQLHGDGIVIDGELVFCELGDQRFYHSAPIGTAYPAMVPEAYYNNALEEVRTAIRKSGFVSGGVNIEVRIKEDGRVFIIEIGPRCGGNYVPQAMQAVSGIDEVECLIRIAMGEPVDVPSEYRRRPAWQYILGSEKAGVFRDVVIDDYMAPKVIGKYIHRTAGESIQEYYNSGNVVGVIILGFDTAEELEKDIASVREHIRVVVD